MTPLSWVCIFLLVFWLLAKSEDDEGCFPTIIILLLFASLDQCGGNADLRERVERLELEQRERELSEAR